MKLVQKSYGEGGVNNRFTPFFYYSLLKFSRNFLANEDM